VTAYFRDRHRAGQIVARHLPAYRNEASVFVLGLPRLPEPSGASDVSEPDMLDGH